MASNVRILPVLAALAIGAFAIKAVAIAEEAGTRAADASSEEEPVTASALPPPSENGEAGAELADPAAACAPGDYIADQAGLSQYEIQVLRNLSDRREQLDARAEALDTRELAVSAAEVRLTDQIDELQRLETQINSLLSKLDDKNDEQLASLVRVYESMKAKDAARIFDTLNDDLMLSLADRMKPANMAAILAAMSPDRARTLTQMMAQKTLPPETVSELEARTGGG